MPMITAPITRERRWLGRLWAKATPYLAVIVENIT